MPPATTYHRSTRPRPALPPTGWHVAAALGLACGSAVAQPQPAADTLAARHEQAQGAYGRGEYAQAFAEYAALADLGHADAARTAALMSCFGPALYGLDLPLAPERVARWPARLPAYGRASVR